MLCLGMSSGEGLRMKFADEVHENSLCATAGGEAKESQATRRLLFIRNPAAIARRIIADDHRTLDRRLCDPGFRSGVPVFLSNLQCKHARV